MRKRPEGASKTPEHTEQRRLLCPGEMADEEPDERNVVRTRSGTPCSATRSSTSLQTIWVRSPTRIRFAEPPYGTSTLTVPS